jgi:hypothetical protein
MAKPLHTRAEMRGLYPVFRWWELAAGWRDTTWYARPTKRNKIVVKATIGLLFCPVMLRSPPLGSCSKPLMHNRERSRVRQVYKLA